MHNPELVLVGHLGLDATISDGKTKTKFGGAGYFSGVGAALLKDSCQTAIVSRVGAHDKGSEIVKQLHRFGIDTTGITIVPDGKTAFFQQNEDNRFRRNRFKSELGVSGDITTIGMPIRFEKAKWFHLPTAPPQQLHQWIHELQDQGIPLEHISVDTFETYARKFPDLTKEVMSKVGLVFLNGTEFSVLRNCFGDDFFRQFPYVLKLGANGAMYRDAMQGTEICVPAIPVTRVESTGAGEVLAGAFNAARMAGLSIPEALRLGVWAGGASVTKSGVEHILDTNTRGCRGAGSQDVHV
jgi:sugar/nucleoside kinase (ribokinase family)